MSSDIHLVESTRHGKPNWAIIFGQKPRFDRNLETIVRVVELTPEEGNLSVGQVVTLCKAGELAAQRKKDPEAGKPKQGALL